jgi:RHS repeat-associated protein
VALELPGWVINAFYLVGLPWPAIDEDQLRAWAAGVRSFTDDLGDSSARTQQAVSALAGSSQSAATDTLAAHWDSHSRLISGLHGPLYDFAEALDLAADAVVVQKGAVIAAAVALATEFVATQVAAFFTFGADEALLPEEIISTRAIVEFALKDLEMELLQKLAGTAAQAVSDDVSRFLGNLLADAPAVVQEIGALKVSYGALRDAAEQVRGHATMTEEAGDTAYAQNANRDLADAGEGGVGSAFAGVVEGVEVGLRDVAVDLFQSLPRLVTDHQRALAEGLDDTATAVEEADSKAAADVPPEEGTLPGSVSSGPAFAAAGAQDADAGPVAGTADLAAGAEPPESAGAIPGAAGDESGLAGASGVTGSTSPVDALTCEADPVDVASGAVVLSQADITLPGVLPLILERTHRSSLRAGRWLGRSWVSSFDQRLLVTEREVIGAFADGRVLTWPRPGEAGGDPVLPAGGAVWPLRRGPDGGYAATDPQRGLTWHFEPRAGYPQDTGGTGELPLVALTDRSGHQIAFHYDAAGQPSSVSHSGGYRVEVTMADGRLAALALASRDGTGNQPLVRYAYDADGNLVGVVNSSGQPLLLGYDSEGRLASWTDRNGQSYRYAYDDEGRCIRTAGAALSGTFGYEPGLTRWTDAAGAVTSYAVTAGDRIAAVTDPLGRVTRFEHDPRGRVSTQVDPLGRITRYAYDLAGHLIAVTRPDGRQALAEHDRHGLVSKLTGPDGATWRQRHDERGNRTELRAPDGSVTRFGYDAAGHLSSVTDAAGAVTTVMSDAAGLPVAVVSPAGARTRYARDPFGRVTEVTAPDGAVTRLSWTPEGHLASRRLPDGSEEHARYDGEGNLVAQVSAAGAATACQYGPFDQLTAMTGPDGTRTELGYDHQLRLTSVVHGGLTWRYEYDEAGQLTAETDYNGAVTRYSYDAAGQLTRRVNAVGQEVAFGYDQVGNLTKRVAGEVVATFRYDAAGRLTGARGPDGDLRFTFDTVGRITGETCNGRTVRTEYDQAGRPVRRVTPSGASASWEYRPDSQPSTLTAGGQQLRFGYDPAGRETRRELPGGLTLSQDWDERGRLTAQALIGSVGRLQGRTYRYQPDGLVTGLDDLLSGNRTIGLDPAGRVIAVTGRNWAEQYAYDQAGNLTAASWPARPSAGPWLGPDAQGHREVTGSLVTRAGNIRYRHDRQGRVTQRQRIRISRKPDTWRYEWDADDRLTSVTTPDGATWRYRYDPLGRRIAKERVAADGTVADRTTFTWDGLVLAEQTAETGERPVVTWNYLPGTFTPVTQAEHAPQGEIDQRFYAIITDLVGTPAELTAPDGTLAGRQVQTLWGGTTWQSGGAQTPLRFPGQYEDEETGLHYNNQRYYDPVSAAYLTPDPLGLAPAPNPHAYVPNPLSQADPLGLMGADCGTAARDVPALPAGSPPSVVPNDLMPHEVAEAWDIVNFRGGEFVGNTVGNAPGIDGFLNGVPVSLKGYAGSSPAAILRKAGLAERSASRAGYSGVEVYINAPGLSRSTLIDFSRNSPLNAIPRHGVVSTIYVLTGGGWVVYPG